MADWNPQANDLFLRAAELGLPADRQAFLERECGADADLKRQVESLLEASGKAGSFLNAPAVDRNAVEGTVEYRPICEGPGSVIGPYKLMEQIGEGGFGLVFVAEQQQPVRRKVALKILKPGMDSREIIARFEAERQALALMDHPHIAKVLDAGTTEAGRPYFVMELVRGIPIVEYCDAQPLGTRQRLELFLTVCQAVQHAHSKGIIHRDLKPSNILVAPHDGIPIVKVIDFGIAKAIGQQLTDKTIYTRFLQMVGTPLYMSPEQAEINALDIDIRSDVYSLGVLLYELLTGTTPFDRQRFQTAALDEIRRIIREEEPPKPSTRLSTLARTVAAGASRRPEPAEKLTALVKGDLDWIVMKALEKDRTRRYETASTFAADVRRYLAEEPIEARPPTLWYRWSKFARRHRATMMVGYAIAALVLVAIGGTSLGLIRARNAEQVSRAEAKRALAAEQLAEDRLQNAVQERDIAQRAKVEADAARQQAMDARLQAELQESTAVKSAKLADSLRVAAYSTVTLPRNPGGALLLAIEAAQRAPERTATHNNALQQALAACREERTISAPQFVAPEGRTSQSAFVHSQLAPDERHLVASVWRFQDSIRRYEVTSQMHGSEVFDVARGRPVATLRLPGLLLAVTDISADSRLVAGATDRNAIVRYANGQTHAYLDHTVRIWELTTGREVAVLKGHTDRVMSVQFDALGERLVTASWDKSARIWDVKTGETLHVLKDDFSLALAQFSPDGKRVLTVHRGETCESQSYVEQMSDLPERVAREQVVVDPPVPADIPVKWSDTSTGYTYSSRTAFSPRLWNAETGALIAALAPEKEDGDADVNAGAAFTPGGEYAITTRLAELRAWQTSDGHRVDMVQPERLLVRLGATDVPEWAFRIGSEANSRRRYLAIIDRPSMLVWQTDDDGQSWRRSAAYHRSPHVKGMSTRGESLGRGGILSGSGHGPPTLAMADGNTVLIRGIERPDVQTDLLGHDQPVVSGAFLDQGRKLLTSGDDGTLRLWRIGPQEVATTLLPADPTSGELRIGTATYSPDGRLVLAGPARDEYHQYKGFGLAIYRADTGEFVRALGDPQLLAASPVNAELIGELCEAQLDPAGQRLLTIHQDLNPRREREAPVEPSPLFTPVRVWDISTGKLLVALQGLKRSVDRAEFSPDGTQILTFHEGNERYAIVKEGQKLGGGSGGQLYASVQLWDAATGQHQRTIVPEEPAGGDYAHFSPDGQQILTNAVYHKLGVAARVFDTKSGELVGRLSRQECQVDRAEWSRDGHWVAGFRTHYLSRQNMLDVWDVRTGQHRELAGHTGDITSVVFSPVKPEVLSTSTDGTARIWDVATGQTRLTLRGHLQSVTQGAMSPDGDLAATVSLDNTVRIWQTDTGREWLTLRHNNQTPLTAEFSPDSQALLTTWSDGTARIWPVDLLPLAKVRQPRTLSDDERRRYLSD